MTGTSHAAGLLEHLFRHQSGRMVAHLTRLLGPAHLDLAEEAVQETMVRALQTWPYDGVPENAAAWLFRVARNTAIDAVRRNRMAGQKADSVVAELLRSADRQPGDPDFEEHLRDDELRMMFMCCHPAIPRDARVALSLKIVAGFSVREIARAFLADDAAIAQRLVRAKALLRAEGIGFIMPAAAELRERLDSVLEVIYLIFNEGYGAHAGEDLIRADLCAEALRLGQMIAASSITAPRVHALVAMMALQAARLPTRIDDAGEMVLLEAQDRLRWDRTLIAFGYREFEKCVVGEDISEYHVQAAIAATHARASRADAIDWRTILELYDQLVEITDSPVVRLNRAVAVAKVHGPGVGLAALESLEIDPKMRHYYLHLAVRGHLLLEVGRRDEAAACFRAALECRCSEPERRFLKRRLDECG